MVLNQATKYGLFFVGGLVVGALGAVAVAKGKKFGGVKPLASSLLSAGIDVKDKVLAGVDGVKEDLADVVAEAQVKSQERREAKEAVEAAEVAAPVAVEEVKEEKKEAKKASAKKTVRRARKAKAAPKAEAAEAVAA